MLIPCLMQFCDKTLWINIRWTCYTDFHVRITTGNQRQCLKDEMYTLKSSRSCTKRSWRCRKSRQCKRCKRNRRSYTPFSRRSWKIGCWTSAAFVAPETSDENQICPSNWPSSNAYHNQCWWCVGYSRILYAIFAPWYCNRVALGTSAGCDWIRKIRQSIRLSKPPRGGFFVC